MNDYLSGGRLWRLCLKELRESLRDRRTVMTLILMPILVYPLLSMAMQRLLLGTVSKGQQPSYVLGVGDPIYAPLVSELLSNAQSLIDAGVISPIPPIEFESRTSAASGENPPNDEKPPGLDSFELFSVTDQTLQSALQSGQIDVAFTKIEKREVPIGKAKAMSFDIEIEFRNGDRRGEDAAILVRRMCQLINDQQAYGLRMRVAPEFSPAVELKTRGVGRKDDATASLVGVIPLVLILMTITGAVYPAIDLTAGERERGTMEAMIATPAPRFALLLSKYAAVVTVAFLTALANLFATWVTFSFGGLGKAIFGPAGFSLWTLLQILPILTIFAAFFSSILLALCSFAKSFKEAQAYLIPVMLICLAPGLVTLMPNIEFTNLFAVVPLLNVLLLSRDIMTGQPPLVPSFIAVITTIAYGAAALVIASHLFGTSHSVMGSQSTWSDLVRRPSKRRDSPDLGLFFIYLAFLFPVLFVISSMASWFEGATDTLMGLNALALVSLFIVVPFAWLSFNRVRLIPSIRLGDGSSNAMAWSARSTRLAGMILASLLVGSTLWMFALEGVLLFKSWSLSEHIDQLESLKQKWLDIPFGWILLTQALSPAIAEEFFFRGFALSAFLGRTNQVRSVLYSAFLFGLFHVITGNVLSPEKFIPTFLLGLVLGTIAVWTNSIWPGVFLHFTHNAVVLWFSRLEPSQLEPWFGNSEHVPLLWLGSGAVVITAGMALFYSLSRFQKSRIAE